MNELRGLPVANDMSESLKLRIENLKNKDIVPKLSVIRVGNNEDDISYKKGIIKKFTSLNALVDVIELPYDTNQEKIEATIISLNKDCSVHGILIFRPLPKHLSEERIKYIIDPEKDVDCIGQINIARVFSGDNNSFHLVLRKL
jgi:methylenetetrahydrofolate dehydrogenase (NADP+)/methenyltetrahydrofolate cyclohydrolase